MTDTVTATTDQAAEVRRRLCTNRTPFPSRYPAVIKAHEVADGWVAYPCPFAPEEAPHWHAGLVLDLDELALAMRGLTEPEPHHDDPAPRPRRTKGKNR